MSLTGSSVIESQLDESSELLIAELVLNDIAAVQATRKGKMREGTPLADEELAFDIQAASLRKLIGVLHDHQFASSVDRAIDSDARQLGRFAMTERAEFDDHRAAVALEDGHELPCQTLSQRIMEQTQTLAQPAREHVAVHHVRASSTPEAEIEAIDANMQNVHIDVESTTPQTSPSHLDASVPNIGVRDEDEDSECVICRDDLVPSRSFKAPCEHIYCQSCLVNLVETYLRDESLHPLRCCHQPLPLTSGIFKFIPVSLQWRFLAKRNEYSTPAGSRVYCSNPRCAAFLDESGDTKRDLICDDCSTVSCSRCKNNAHPGEDCIEHQSVLELRETAATNKWQTCPGCHAIVELNQGCYHITCRCQTQFCYLCSARWKTCDCQQWDEENLLNDAERRVLNEFGGWGARDQPEVHAERVYQRMEELRVDHECQHHSWHYRHGSGRCEQCGDLLSIFLLRCIHCQALVCRRCSVNRL